MKELTKLSRDIIRLEIKLNGSILDSLTKKAPENQKLLRGLVTPPGFEPGTY